MYSINGIELENPTFGWRFLRRSQALMNVGKELASIAIPGRNGVLAGVPTFKSAPTATFVIHSTGLGVEALYALLERNGGYGTLALTDDSQRNTSFELASITAEGISASDRLVDVSFTLRFPTADWRATSFTIENPTVSGTVTNADVFSDISSSIADADIFITGTFGKLRLDDIGSGSWLETVTSWVPAGGLGLLYNTSTGRTWTASTADPWTPITELGGYFNTSGSGGFRIAPTWSTDPSVRTGKVKLTLTTATSVTFKIRAKKAFALRDGSI